jgi:hypothetical protein
MSVNRNHISSRADPRAASLHNNHCTFQVSVESPDGLNSQPLQQFCSDSPQTPPCPNLPKQWPRAFLDPLLIQSMQVESTDSRQLLNCKHCRGLSLEKLAAPGGYLHAPSRSSLVRSAQKCSFCSLLFRKDRSRHNSQLRLSIGPFSDEDSQICLKISHLANNTYFANNKNAVQNPLAFFLYTSPGKISGFILGGSFH